MFLLYFCQRWYVNKDIPSGLEFPLADLLNYIIGNVFKLE